MHLGVHRKAAVLESFDQMHLPQRAVPVQQRAVQTRGELQELTHPARVGQRRAAQVVFEVDLWVYRPGQFRDPAHDLTGMLTEGRGGLGVEEQFLVELADEVRAGTRWWLVHVQPAHVHRVLARLAHQEHAIQR